MSTGNNDKHTCQMYQHLVAWYPTSSLNDNERRQVEGHAAGCVECSKLLEFASDLKTILTDDFSLHPAADVLVNYVENRRGLEDAALVVVETHLQTCGECRSEVEMLEAVDQSDSVEDSIESPSRRPTRRAVDTSDGSRNWWDVLSGVAFRPAAAAAYLVVAVVAVGLLISRLDPGGLSGAGDTDGVLGGVTILSDEDSVVRGGEAESGFTAVESGRSCSLLLELTGLDAPPEPSDVYTVCMTARDTQAAVFRKTVTGADFRDNYTLSLFFPEGSLARGEYLVEVTDPAGNRVFRSSLNVE